MIYMHVCIVPLILIEKRASDRAHGFENIISVTQTYKTRSNVYANRHV